MTHRAAFAVLAGLLAVSPALAQSVTPPATPEAPGEPVAPSSDPCAARPGDDGQSLSGQLADCGGVLTPPDTGTSGIEAPVPAPDPGTTPVIPPGAVPPQPDGQAGANPT